MAQILLQVRFKGFNLWSTCYDENEFNMWKGLINPKTNKPFYQVRTIEDEEENYLSTPLRLVKMKIFHNKISVV